MTRPPRGTRNAEPAVYALLLAAGSGARFGGEKLLAPLHGRPLVVHAAAAVAEAIAAGVLAGGVAVVPPAATALAWHLDVAGLSLVENPAPASGLSSSLRLGLEHLAGPSEPPAAAALVVLADQPALRAAVIATLVQSWRATGRSVRPRYASAPAEPGHPVLLDRSAWPLAKELQGDAGFRSLLGRIPLTIADVPGANPDVDTPDDLHRLEQQG